MLAVVAAALSVGALVVGGIVAAAVSGRGVVAAVAVAAAGFLGLGLAIGWRPALAMGLGLGLVTALVLPSTPVPWLAAAVLGVAVVVAHEAGRLSIDLRRPSRLGPEVLGRLMGSAAAVAAAAPMAAFAGAVMPVRSLPGLAVPLALMLAAVPVAVPVLAGGMAVRPSLGGAGAGSGPPRSWVGAGSRILSHVGPSGRLAAAGVVAALVVGAALVGAAARDELTSVTAPGAGASYTVSTDPPTAPPAGGGPAAPADQPGEQSERGSVVTIVLVTAAACVVVLLLVRLRRNRIPLEQDQVDVEPDEPGLALVGAADLDDEAVVLADEVAASIVADLTIDLRSEPDPGRAVRFAYARVEQRLAAVGIERRPAESEHELLGRALGVLGDDGRALADLTALFERARFSDEPVPEALRTGAIAALDLLRGRLEPAR